jgi:mono/diheme cytochrome c family protein
MKTLVSSLMVTLVFAATAAHSQEPASNGKALYKEKCVMCHDKTGMGTGILSRRVKVAELLLRTDLNPAYITAAARSGIGNMPAIPRGEVSDRDLQAIADYLAQPLEARK